VLLRFADFCRNTMKKTLVSILLLLYISANSGAILHVHYCMDKVAGWDFGFAKKSNNCTKCGMEKKSVKKNACCKDEEKILQNNTDQKTAETIYELVPSASFALPTLVFETPTFNFSSLVFEKPISRALIRVDGIPVYIRDCVFLI
jgi:hypothetical protein